MTNLSLSLSLKQYFHYDINGHGMRFFSFPFFLYLHVTHPSLFCCIFITISMANFAAEFFLHLHFPGVQIKSIDISCDTSIHCSSKLLWSRSKYSDLKFGQIWMPLEYLRNVSRPVVADTTDEMDKAHTRMRRQRNVVPWNFSSDCFRSSLMLSLSFGIQEM